MVRVSGKFMYDLTDCMYTHVYTLKIMCLYE